MKVKERKKKILQLVVRNYILTAQPVGSRTIARKCNLDLSPATIRNVMADLEEEKFLTHPYSSAGRIPTDKGYRFYVETLSIHRLSLKEEDCIQKEFLCNGGGIEQIIKQTSRMLSSISHYTGLVLTPELERSVLKHIELVGLNSQEVLGIIVTRSGLVKSKVIRLRKKMSQAELKKITEFSNENLVGLNLEEIKKLIETIEEKSAKKDLFKQVLEIMKHSLPLEKEGKIYLEGRSNILLQPEFKDMEKRKALFKILEEEEILSSLLKKILDEEGVRVVIGEENPCSVLKECSIVISAYKIRERAMGVLGIIGPKRMRYAKVIPLVEFTTKVISKIL